METKKITKSLSKVLQKSYKPRVIPPVDQDLLTQTLKVSLAEAGNFDTMKSPYKSVNIQNKRKRDARSKSSEEDRETVFWSGLSRTRETKLKGSFTLPNCVKTFRIQIWGVDSSGTYGLFTSWLTVQKLFNVVLKVPPFIRSHEEVKCFISMENNKRGDMRVEIPKFKTDLEIPQGSGVNYDFQLKPENIPYKLKIVDTQTFEKIFRKVQIPTYRGHCFENSQTMELQVRRGDVGGNRMKLQLPSDIIPHTTHIRVEYKQLGIDIIMKGIENLMEQPSGGFEQTCSVAFSLTMLSQYIGGLKKKNERLVNMKIFAEERLEEALHQLESFECKNGGFEMFGTGKGDVTLTAYGIWLMSEVLTIKKFKEKILLDRTLNWLRNNYKKSGVKFNMKKHLRQGQAFPTQFRSDIYIMFVLTLLRDRFSDYRTIVLHKMDDYDMKIDDYKIREKMFRLDSYLRSILSMIYMGKPISANLSSRQTQKGQPNDRRTGRRPAQRRVLH